MAQSLGSGQIGAFQKQLRHLLSDISPPQNHINYLWEMSVHQLDTTVYTIDGRDTLDAHTYAVLYEELYYMQYDTTKNLKVDSVFSLLDSLYFEDSIPLAMVFLDYARTKFDSVLLDTLYFDYDTADNKIFDLPGRASHPLKVKQVFQVVPLIWESYFGDVTFIIDTNFHLLDAHTRAVLNDPNTTVYVDFKDSIGLRAVDFMNPGSITCNYTDSGIHIIDVYLEYGEDTLATSHSSYKTLKSGAREKPTYWGLYGDLRYGVYESCNSSNWKEDKLFILCGGFDDILSEPLLNPSDRKLKKNIAKWYDKKMRRSGLADLRNHGYSVVVLDYSSTRKSVISMGNALAAFLDHLKCETAGSDEQFVIMGTSYGAKVAQYALSLMETEDWMEHPDFQSCQPELMHKTRLFISQEGPHIGDNIPLSLQHYAWSIPDNFPNLFFADEMERTFIRKVLNSRGVRENLLCHVSTANNGNHGPAPEWTVLHDSLRALRPDNMGFPVFCKKVAVINGMLTGEAQYSPRDGVQFMADGSRFLEANTTDILSTILGLQINFRTTDGVLNLNPNGNGNLSEFERITNRPQLDLIWIELFPWPFTIRIPAIVINLVQTTTNTVIPGTNLIPFCSRNGGKMGEGSHFTFELKNGLFGGGLVMTNTTTGEVEASISSLFWNKVINRTSTLSSDGLVMNFGPVGSAMADEQFYDDFRNGAPMDLDRDYNANLNATFDDTPFDVIMGMLPEVAEHLVHGDLKNYELPSTLSNGRQARILNLEVGDDTLFLENLTMNRKARFSAAIELSIESTPNRYYSYDGFNPNTWLPIFFNSPGSPHNGIISRDNRFIFQSNDTLFLRYGMNLANDSTAWILSTATIDSAQQFIAVCPFDYSDEMIGPSLVEQESELSDFGFKVYPNPTMNYLNIESEILEIHYVLYELNGAVIHNGSVNSTAKESIDLSKHPPGVYLLQLNSEHGTYSYKILKY